MSKLIATVEYVKRINVEIESDKDLDAITTEDIYELIYQRENDILNSHKGINEVIITSVTNMDGSNKKYFDKKDNI